MGQAIISKQGLMHARFKVLMMATSLSACDKPQFSRGVQTFLRNLLPPFSSEDVANIFLEHWATFSVSGNDATSAARLHSTEWQDYRRLIEKDLGSSSHSLIKVISWHLPEGLKKTMRTLSQDSWCPDQMEQFLNMNLQRYYYAILKIVNVLSEPSKLDREISCLCQDSTHNS